MNVRLSVTLVALALLGSGTVRAEMVEFSYSLSVSRQVVSGSGGVQANAFVSSPSGTASTLLGATTGQNLGGFYWRFFTPSNTSPPGYVDTTVNVRLSLTDHASGQSGQIDVIAHFQGLAGGQGGAFSQQPTMSYSPTTTQAMQLGDHLYHVSSSSIAELTDATYTPSFAFQVTTASIQAPEPSSLALGAVAGLGLALRRWRRGRSTAGERR